jgi:hypothetical protein
LPMIWGEPRGALSLGFAMVVRQLLTTKFSSNLKWLFAIARKFLCQIICRVRLIIRWVSRAWKARFKLVNFL